MGDVKFIDKQPDGSFIESDNLFEHGIYSNSGGGKINWKEDSKFLLKLFGVLFVFCFSLALIKFLCE